MNSIWQTDIRSGRGLNYIYITGYRTKLIELNYVNMTTSYYLDFRLPFYGNLTFEHILSQNKVYNSIPVNVTTLNDQFPNWGKAYIREILEREEEL